MFLHLYLIFVIPQKKRKADLYIPQIAISSTDIKTDNQKISCINLLGGHVYLTLLFMKEINIYCLFSNDCYLVLFNYQRC